MIIADERRGREDVSHKPRDAVRAARAKGNEVARSAFPTRVAGVVVGGRGRILAAYTMIERPGVLLRPKKLSKTHPGSNPARVGDRPGPISLAGPSPRWCSLGKSPR